MVDVTLADDTYSSPGVFTRMRSNNHIVDEKDSNGVAEEQVMRVCIIRTLVLAQMAVSIGNDFSGLNLTSWILDSFMLRCDYGCYICFVIADDCCDPATCVYCSLWSSFHLFSPLKPRFHLLF